MRATVWTVLVCGHPSFCGLLVSGTLTELLKSGYRRIGDSLLIYQIQLAFKQIFIEAWSVVVPSVSVVFISLCDVYLNIL